MEPFQQRNGRGDCHHSSIDADLLIVKVKLVASWYPEKFGKRELARGKMASAAGSRLMLLRLESATRWSHGSEVDLASFMLAGNGQPQRLVTC